QGQRPEDLFDLDVPVGAGDGDERAVREGDSGFVAVVPGRFELDEFLAEQAGLADVGHGVGGQVDVPVDEQDDFGLPVVGVGEFDGFHPADGDVVDLHRRVRHEVEYVVEVRRDPIGMIAEVGAAGQGEVVEAAELRGTAGGR